MKNASVAKCANCWLTPIIYAKCKLRDENSALLINAENEVHAVLDNKCWWALSFSMSLRKCLVGEVSILIPEHRCQFPSSSAVLAHYISRFYFKNPCERLDTTAVVAKVDRLRKLLARDCTQQFPDLLILFTINLQLLRNRISSPDGVIARQ